LLERNSSTWEREATGELELLSSYIDGQEQTIGSTFLNYRERAEEHEVGDGDHVDLVTVVDGLDDRTWHLPSVFIDYFPNLHRKAQLVSLCIFLEDQLHQLCTHQRSEKGLGVRVEDLRHQGIPRAVNYLTKVAGLKINRGNKTYQHINHLRLVRNAIVHTNGRADTNNTTLLDHAKAHNILHEGAFVIRADYVQTSLRTLNTWLGLIDRAIREDS
jgi:hypothetical protein